MKPISPPLPVADSGQIPLSGSLTPVPMKFWKRQPPDFPHSAQNSRQKRDKKTKKERVERGVYKDVIAHDIIKYGLIPELVGRLPVIVTLENLDEEALVRIIREPKNSLAKQYKKLFGLDGIELEFEDDAYRAIAHLAIERETGARGLRSIIEGLMMKPMFELPSLPNAKRVIVTAGFVRGEEELTVIYDDTPALPDGDASDNKAE